MKMLRGLAGLAFAAAISLPQAPARALDQVSIGTVGSVSANIWPVFIGVKKGFFEGEGVKADIVFVQSSAALVQQVAAG